MSAAAGRSVLRRPSSVAALALASVTLLVGAVGFGLRLPGTALLDPFPGLGRIDYSAGPPGGFAPLDPGFVHSLLGTTSDRIATPVTAAGADRATLASGGIPPEVALGTPTLSVPVEVRHTFDNDDFKHAYRIPSIPFTARTSTAGASAEPDEPYCGPLAGRSAWYVYTAPRDMGLLADTFGTDVAMSLTVYTGSQLKDLRRVPDTECSSDARGNALVAFPAKAGTTYYFQVDGPVAGNIVFTVHQQGVTRRASVGSEGQQGDGASLFGVIAHSGREVLMASGASTFDEPDPARPCVRREGVVAPCGKIGMYLRDGVRHRTTNKYPSQSVAAAGADSEKGSLAIPGSMSADGRYFVFWTTVQARTPGTNARTNSSPYRFEVFRHDNVTGSNERVSVPCPQPKCGTETTDSSVRPEISADGRFVAFVSWAENLVQEDANGVRDVFVRDMVTRVTSRVDVPSDSDRDLGEPNGAETQEADPRESGDRGADLFSISRDGRYVVFKSSSSNLVRRDTNKVSDVFVRDRVTGTTTRVNVSSTGQQADHQTKSVLGLGLHTISDDGRYVFFNSNATNLVFPPTAEGVEHVYLRDLRRGTTTLVSVSSTDLRADQGVKRHPTRAAFTYLAPLLVAGGNEVGLSGLSYSATPDGRYVVFNSDATNLVPGDNNNTTDIFLRDLTTRTTTRVSVTSKGQEAAEGSCGTPSLSADARFVVFDCTARNLVDGDTNESDDVFVRELPAVRPLSGWY